MKRRILYLQVDKKKPSLKKMVRRWIAAEWRFRFGWDRHSTEAQDVFVNAEENLRKALTGKRDLRKAVIKLRGGPEQGCNGSKEKFGKKKTNCKGETKGRKKT